MSAAYKRASTLVGLPDLDRGWEEVQAKTFTKWLNAKLAIRDIPPMTSLVRDLADGVLLIQLMEIMGDVSLGRYYKAPRMRVQMAENVNRALDFIKSRGVVLTNVGAEDIIDGNLKLILGMIWTLILRFTIADISEEGVTAKEGLLLWCQRKTAPYAADGVDVQNFSTSWRSGLALCALIHRHRPDLLAWETLPKHDAHACTRQAFAVASQHLGIPALLDVEDLCDRAKPDEKSVMTYVAQYFHAFSSMEAAEAVSRRVAAFADTMQGAWLMQHEYERRAQALVRAMQDAQARWADAEQQLAAAGGVAPYADAKRELQAFNAHKQNDKRSWVQERTDLAALLGNIQTKLRTYHLREWAPAPGLGQAELDAQWERLAQAEARRSRSINAQIRQAKEALRVRFAEQANSVEKRLRAVATALGGLGAASGVTGTSAGSSSSGAASAPAGVDAASAAQQEAESLAAQRSEVRRIQEEVLAPIAQHDMLALQQIDVQCQEANVEENDHTIFTLDDLRFELELVTTSVAKKLAFIENQIVSRNHTNLTPAQLEEFESTFRFFDKDATNTLGVAELSGALASLGIVYSDEDMEQIHLQLSQNFGAVNYDAFLTFLREIIEDTTSPDQLLEAFQGLAGEKPYVTELDLRMALLPQGSIDYLKASMPEVHHPANGAGADGQEHEERKYDYGAYLTGLFSPSLG